MSSGSVESELNGVTDLPRLESDTETPLYQQLKNWLVERIRNESFDAGAALPSERSLVTALKVSRSTVRQAIDALEREGWVVRQHGRGTFINEAKIEQPVGRVSSFSENMHRAGVTPSSRVVSARLAEPDDRLARVLKLAPGQVVAMVERVRLADGEALMLERSHLNARFVPEILEHDLSGSLYKLLTKHYRLTLSTGEESLEVIEADPSLSCHLGIETGAAVLYTERLVSDDEGNPLEFAQRYARADKCRFRVALSGENADFALKAS